MSGCFGHTKDDPQDLDGTFRSARLRDLVPDAKSEHMLCGTPTITGPSRTKPKTSEVPEDVATSVTTARDDGMFPSLMSVRMICCVRIR